MPLFITDFLDICDPVEGYEKTGKKPGTQAGHPHHPRKPMEPDQVVEIAVEENVTAGARSPSVGMVNGLCREFSSKSRQEQDALFMALLDAPVMYVDGTVARVNGNNNNVVVCSNGTATMYFAGENKGHAGIKDTPVESFGGILIHDHEACFYSYGSYHQECMVHIGRYLKDSMGNEKELTWSRQMLGLIQEMIHESNLSPADGIKGEKIAGSEARYDAIVKKAGEEYEDVIQRCLNVRQDKGLPRVPCYRTLFSPPREK